MTTPATPDPPLPISSFEDFGLSPEVLKAIAGLGYKSPTPVQQQSIPPGLAGADMVVQSRTGTGKTAAFGIPMVECIDLDLLEPQALVLCPTRELALQVHNEIQALGKVKGVRTYPIYGGASMRNQIDALQAGLHVIAGTPGRVLDHLRSRRLSFKAVKYLVLDEADELLSMGFYEEVSAILDRVPRERQTMLFSATLPPGVEGLIYRHQKEPVRLALSSDNVLVAEIHHAFYICKSMDKPANLARILLHEEPRSAIIFVNTRYEARVVTAYLQREGFEADMLSGELSQRDREKVMGAIKRNELRYMVATDVAARGIDISDLSHVINYAPPENPDVYVHRTGRTGRIGKSGTAITLVGLRDLPRWGAFERMKGLEMEERQPPSDGEILEKQIDRVIHAVRLLEAKSSEDRAADPIDEKYVVAGERLLEQGLDKHLIGRLLAAALQPREPAPAHQARVRDEPREDDYMPPRPAKSAAPRSAAPRSAAPRSAAPRSAAPRSAAPRSAAPRSAAPRSAAPRPEAPRSADESSDRRPPRGRAADDRQPGRPEPKREEPRPEPRPRTVKAAAPRVDATDDGEQRQPRRRRSRPSRD